MSAEARRLLNEAMKLPENERAALAAVLADTLGASSSQADVDAAWIAEARLRLEQLRAGVGTTVAWEDIRGRLQARVDEAKAVDSTTG